MRPTNQLRSVLLILSWLSWISAGIAVDLNNPPDEPNASAGGTDELKMDVQIPFTISETGHPLVMLTCGDRTLRMVLDTAAGANVLTPSVVKSLGSSVEITNKKAGKAAGLGTKGYSTMTLTPIQISSPKATFLLDDLVAIDLSHVQKAGGKEGIDGLLGAPFFRKNLAVIDYSKNVLSFRVSAPAARAKP